MEKKITLTGRLAKGLTVFVGICLFAGGLYLYSWRDAQVSLYNQGLAAYQSDDLQTAIKFFDQSLSIYKTRQRSTWMERFVFPKPDKELAAQAACQKAKSLLRANQVEPAVQAFKESLQLNSGNLYLGRDLSEQEFNALREAAMYVKYDVELLFNNNPELARKQGKGKGDGNPQDGKPVPSDDPGGQPGKGDRNTI